MSREISYIVSTFYDDPWLCRSDGFRIDSVATHTDSLRICSLNLFIFLRLKTVKNTTGQCDGCPRMFSQLNRMACVNLVNYNDAIVFRCQPREL